MRPALLEVQRLEPGEGARLRAVRLRALLDAPDAYARTHAEEAAQPLTFWAERLADPESVNLVAHEVESGRDLGLVACLPWRGTLDTLGLFGMWVDPEARGQGVGDALVRGVVEHARRTGFSRILLDVSDGNDPARALYARHGFEPTGVRGTLPPPREHITEHQLVLELHRR